MSKQSAWLAFIVLFLAACSNNANKPEEEIPEPTEVPKEISELEGLFPRFYTYLYEQDTSFSALKFEQTESNPMDSAQAFPVDKKKLQPFADYLIYDKDSSLAIDLFSYNYIPVQRNGKTVLEEGEPDTEVGLIDVKAKTRRRIFFSGPGISIQEAKWQNGQTIFLAGVEEIGPDAVQPMLLKINLPAKTTEVYHYSDTLHANVNNWNYGLSEPKPIARGI